MDTKSYYADKDRPIEVEAHWCAGGNSMSTPLTIYAAARIANRYGQSIRYELANYREACANHGNHGKSATEYFDSYMAQEAAESRADSLEVTV